MSCACHYLKGRKPTFEARSEQLCTRTRNDFVVLRGDDQRRRSHEWCVPPGLKLIQQQPPHGDKGEVGGSDFLDAIKWSDQDKPSGRPKTCDVDGNSAPQAPPHDVDLRMVGVGHVKKRQSIREERFLRRPSGTSAIATVRECNRKKKHTRIDILRVSSEINKSSGAVFWSCGYNHLLYLVR